LKRNKILNKKIVKGLVSVAAGGLLVLAPLSTNLAYADDAISPTTPSDLMVVPDITSAFLAWNPATSDSDSYAVDIYDVADGNALVQENSLDSSSSAYEATGLTPSTEYNFVLTDLSSGQTYTEYDATTAAAATIPYSPTSLIGNFSGNQAQLSWNAPTFDGGNYLYGYYVVVTDSNGQTYTDITNDTSDYISVDAINHDVTYTATVEAMNSIGRSEATQPLNLGNIQITYPDDPQNVTATQIDGTDNVSVTWDAPDTDGGSPITSYTINEYDLDGNLIDSEVTDPSSGTTAVFLGTGSVSNYIYGVSVQTESGFYQSDEITTADSDWYNY
jgi:hypothetical protein